MSISTVLILATLFGISATIISFFMIIPEEKRVSMTHPFSIYLHNLFNFKKLWIEGISKFFYVFSTFASIIGGFFMLFWVEQTQVYHPGSSWYDEGYYTTSTQWRGYIGFIVMILGPIIIRITYEFIMMQILLLKNVMDINKKVEVNKPESTEISMVVEEDEIDP